jgi:hypothetical protein
MPMNWAIKPVLAHSLILNAGFLYFLVVFLIPMHVPLLAMIILVPYGIVAGFIATVLVIATSFSLLFGVTKVAIQKED